ncbi:MAG TPA: glycosyltransferase family 2 protein [Dehalococcoidia bacterium]|nr:glycosyltransferase family 2 protein [Dehalococcoidia bacterium]
MDLSIIIVSYNSRDHLCRCLQSLAAHPPAVEHEVIVVDNDSRDGSAPMVVSEFPQVLLLRLPRNVGFAAGANRGAREATGEAVVLLNPDSEIAADPFAPMLAYLREHDDAGIVAPRLLNPDESLQLSCRRFPTFSVALFNRYSLLTRLFPRNRYSRQYLLSDWHHDSVSDVDWVSGACLMVRRSLFEEIGLLDESYFMYIEDVDLCQRVHRAGYKVVYLPQTSVIHHIGRSSRTLPSRSIVARHRSMWHYYKKYLRRNVVVDIAVAGGIVARCGYLLLANRARGLTSRGENAAD